MCLNVWELRWIISLGFFSYGVWARKILPLFFKLCLAFILTALGPPGCCSSDFSRQKLSSEGNQSKTVGLWSSMSVKSMAVSRRPKQEPCRSHFGQVEKKVHCLPWDYQEMKIVPRNLPWVSGDSWGPHDSGWSQHVSSDLKWSRFYESVDEQCIKFNINDVALVVSYSSWLP